VNSLTQLIRILHIRVPRKVKEAAFRRPIRAWFLPWLQAYNQDQLLLFRCGLATRNHMSARGRAAGPCLSGMPHTPSIRLLDRASISG
jgi:hypothetical protein